MDNIIWKDAEKALKMIVDKTGDLGGGCSYAEKLQRLLDLPCEICDDGAVIDRLQVLLRKAIKALEDLSETDCIMDTNLADELGITQEEYDELM